MKIKRRDNSKLMSGLIKMEGDKIFFEGHEFKNSKSFRIWTESELMRLQDLFLETKEEKHITKMFQYIELYSKSFLLKHFSPYILNLRNLNERAYHVAKEVVIQYYKRKDFRINDSFGGYIKFKCRQVVFSTKNTLESCADYIKLEDREMEVQINKLYYVPEILEIVLSSFKVYISFYNHKFDYWNDYKLIAKENSRKEFDFEDDNIIGCKKILLDHKLKAFMIVFDKEFANNNKFKMKVKFKVRSIVRGLSLDADNSHNNNNINNSSNNELTLGEIIQAEDLAERYDECIEGFDVYDVLEHLKEMIDETGKNPYCNSPRIDLHRLIALRNRLLYGEEKTDEFFKLFNKDSKILYEKTMGLMYQILKDNCK